MLTGPTFRVTSTPAATELYFPPLRMPEVALGLGAFGVIGTTLTGITIVALFPSALSTPASLLTSVLLAAFVVPFMILALMCILTSIYMVSNALRVRVDPDAIHTARLLFGVIVRRARIERSAITAIEPEIASRYQSIFSATPVYQLVAKRAGGGRLLVAETLKGDSVMHHVQHLLENALQTNLSAKGASHDR